MERLEIFTLVLTACCFVCNSFLLMVWCHWSGSSCCRLNSHFDARLWSGGFLSTSDLSNRLSFVHCHSDILLCTLFPLEFEFGHCTWTSECLVGWMDADLLWFLMIKWLNKQRFFLVEGGKRILGNHWSIWIVKSKHICHDSCLNEGILRILFILKSHKSIWNPFIHYMNQFFWHL